MALNRITNWFNLSKQYFFTYRDGFFNLSFLSNSPDLIVKSSLKMPFMGHNKEQQKLIVDTPFIKGNCYYAELETGLWVLNSVMTYKNNVSLSPIYDKILESNYYCLAVNFVDNNYNLQYFESNNIKISNQSISFIKPESDYLHCHFKGSTTTMFIVYFSREWLHKNILNSPSIKKSTLKLFEKEDRNFINYKYESQIFNTIVNRLSESFKNSTKPNFLELKKLTFNFLELFLDNIENIEGYELKKIPLKDSIKIRKIEHYLMNNLYAKFPGIDYLSKKFKISSTKLKKDFKLHYNQPIFYYYQSKQMELASKYIQQNMLVKDVAEKFNYENRSKFSNTFQKFQGVLPSEFVQ